LKNSDRDMNFLGRVARYFVSNRQIAFLLILVILTLGLTSVVILPKESLPEIVFPTVIVQTVYTGASTIDVEQLVTDPIEAKLSGISDLDNMTSVSSGSFSVITLSFNENVDVQRKELEVQSLLGEISLPEGASDPSVRIFNTSEFPILTFSVSGPYDLVSLEAIAEEIQNAVERIPNVDEVSLAGGRIKEVQVIINPYKLFQANLSLDDVSNALKGRNLSFPIGEQTIGGLNHNLRVEGTFEDLTNIEEVLVTSLSGQSVFIRDIAEVIEGEKPVKRINRTFFRTETGTDVNESVYGVVTRKKGADVISTSQLIQSTLEEGKGSLYPSDVSISILFDNALNVQRDLSNIQLSAFSGLAMVLLVLFLFIGLKESLVVALTVPLSLLMTLGFLNYIGITLNAFAILGLIVALGLLVDNSIIVMENIDRFYRLGYKPVDAAIYGTNEVGLPILASTLTTVAAFFPLAILPGILGAFVNTIPRTIILALLSSLLISITVTPSIYALLKKLKKSSNQKNFLSTVKGRYLKLIVSLFFVSTLSFLAFYDPLLSLVLPFGVMILFVLLIILKFFLLKDGSLEDSIVTKVYTRFLNMILKNKLRQIGILFLGFILFLGSGVLIPLGILKINFFPQNEPTSISITVDSPSGTTIEDTQKIVETVETALVEESTIKVFNVSIGGQEANFAAIDATLYDKRERIESGFDVLNRVEETLKDIPGAQITVAGSAGGGPPVGKPIVYEFIVEDYAEGILIAEQYKNLLVQQPGVFNAALSLKDGAPDLRIDINKSKASSLGLSVLNVANQVRAGINGIVSTTLKEGQSLVDVRVLYIPPNHDPIVYLENMLLVTPQGVRIPLSEIAQFEISQGISNIQRQNRTRFITLDADLQEGFNARETINALNLAASDIDIPNSVQVKIAGDQEGIQENFANLIQSMILAILLVFIILTIQFKSLAQPFTILTTVPMALIGVFGGLVITGNEFGFYAFMGLVALVGIAVNDAIVLIDFINSQRLEGKSIKDAIIVAGKIRFNPVLATTMTTIGGVLPLAFREVYYAQFSYALVFGLLATTVLTLIFIPIVYNLIEGLKISMFKLGKE
jgi:multidrug efflux pump subunit AcrB